MTVDRTIRAISDIDRDIAALVQRSLPRRTRSIVLNGTDAFMDTAISRDLSDLRYHFTQFGFISDLD